MNEIPLEDEFSLTPTEAIDAASSALRHAFVRTIVEPIADYVGTDLIKSYILYASVNQIYPTNIANEVHTNSSSVTLLRRVVGAMLTDVEVMSAALGYDVVNLPMNVRFHSLSLSDPTAELVFKFHSDIPIGIRRYIQSLGSETELVEVLNKSISVSFTIHEDVLPTIDLLKSVFRLYYDISKRIPQCLYSKNCLPTFRSSETH